MVRGHRRVTRNHPACLVSRLDARLIRLAVAVLLRGTSEHGSTHTPRRNPGGNIGSRKMMTLNLQSLLFAVTCAAGIVAGAAETASSFALVDISATISLDLKFYGAAVAGDGRVVFAPFNADGVGVFDPTDDSFTLVDISATIDSDFKFNGAAVAGDGRVVFAPRNAHGVGLFNPPCTCCESKMMRFGFSAGRVCVLPPP